jgi:hypothetical protein
MHFPFFSLLNQLLPTHPTNLHIFTQILPVPILPFYQGFTIGQTLAISWQTTEIIGQVTILLKSAQAPNQQFIISENRPYGDIPATYKLHNGILPGNFYAIVRQGTQSWRSKPFMINSLTVSPPWKKIEKKDKKIFKKN